MNLRQLNDDILRAYAEGKLDEIERIQVEAALDDTPNLKAKIELMQQFDQKLCSALDVLDRIPTPKAQILAGIAQRLRRIAPEQQTIPTAKAEQLRIEHEAPVDVQKLDPQIVSSQSLKIQERCATMVATLNTELGWHLEEEQQHSYVLGLLAYFPDLPAEPALRRIVLTYHHDHALVEILGDPANPQYEAAWSDWNIQIMRILQSRGLSTSGDASADLQDLTQIALEELLRALPNYRYSSRFPTWAYTVTSNRALRYLRDRSAAKRNGKLESLERRQNLGLALGAADSPEAQSEAQELNNLIHALLDKHGDQHLSKMFHLWVIEEHRLTDIARHMGLSPARVSGLIDEMCHMIRQEPLILAWINNTVPLENIEEKLMESQTNLRILPREVREKTSESYNTTKQSTRVQPLSIRLKMDLRKVLRLSA